MGAAGSLAEVAAQSAPTIGTGALIGRGVLGFGLGWLIGFERGVRGAPVGDRTIGLVGLAAALLGALAWPGSPQLAAGVVTGVGFLGGGIVLRGRSGGVHGLTTAASVLGVAALGLVVGSGYLLAGTIVTVITVTVLELPYIPLLRVLDYRRYVSHFTNDRSGIAGGDDTQPG